MGDTYVIKKNKYGQPQTKMDFCNNKFPGFKSLLIKPYTFIYNIYYYYYYTFNTELKRMAFKKYILSAWKSGPCSSCSKYRQCPQNFPNKPNVKQLLLR